VTRPVVVELAGPAGSGKSTVWMLLSARPGIGHASCWNLPRPLLVVSALRTLPVMAAVVRRSRAFPWEHLKQLIRLDALARYLRRLRSADDDVILMDEGAVLAMSWLRVLGPECFRDGQMDDWWRSTFDAWAPVLDGVVVLDAPDRMLVQRMRARAKRHPYQHRPEAEINAFSAAYREAIDWVIASLTARADTRVIALETNGAGPVHVAERVLAGLEELVHAR
jgi:AAA domain